VNTLKSIVPAPHSVVPTTCASLSADTRQVLALGEQRRWPFRVLGTAPLPEEPVQLGGWLLVPAQQDSTPLPARTMTRIQAIFAAGIQPMGFVVVHEAPKLLKAPLESLEPRVSQAPTVTGTTLLPGSTSDALAAVGTAMSTMASIILPMFAFVAAAMLDPLICAVLAPDSAWVEVDRWQTEEP